MIDSARAMSSRCPGCYHEQTCRLPQAISKFRKGGALPPLGGPKATTTPEVATHSTAHHFLEAKRRQNQDGEVTLRRRLGETHATMTVPTAATAILRISAPSPT